MPNFRMLLGGFSVIRFLHCQCSAGGITPSQTVSLRGFFITTQPIRLSDYKRSRPVLCNPFPSFGSLELSPYIYTY